MTDLLRVCRSGPSSWPTTAGEARHWRQFTRSQLQAMVRTRYVVTDEEAFMGFGREELITALELWSRRNNGKREEAREG